MTTAFLLPDDTIAFNATVHDLVIEGKIPLDTHLIKYHVSLNVPVGIGTGWCLHQSLSGPGRLAHDTLTFYAVLSLYAFPN
jgi:hypothetical protein